MGGVLGPVVPLVLAAWTAFAGDLSVTVTGIRSSAGMIRVAVFDNPGDFPRGQEIDGDLAPAAPEVTIVFENFPPGRYAVAVHHDENGNNRMDSNLLGLPQEGYAFSNNVMVFMGPPSFTEASFEVQEEGKHITIEMDY